ncbi:peptidase C15, pyroglutamyl peptidase I-like protein [Daedalea quercina L-15889]|uniref:Peptidase C15, pyroglutamyl peptidase I-like protein n=1 Tax=Daedalea quercina L-15889 TaxID=1314783 RepID=A0A165SIH5_9APHY|nr:peptidase C15, pyroglutamyl peptidase I-like protein [Daedalea quercina L-15889]
MSSRESPPAKPDDAPQDSTALHVLVTGYGPFLNFKLNPSWLAVKPLHNTTLRTLDASARPIHITTLKVPVTYASVLSLTPGFHVRPPVLPEPEDPDFAQSLAPTGGFDFILHVGVAGPGSMRVEKRGRKIGYNKPDTEGKFCATVPTDNDGDEDGQDTVKPPSALGQVGSVLYSWTNSLTAYLKMPLRGFGAGYEQFPEELFTQVDSEGLIKYLKETGFTHIVPSTNAGLFLCEFINYCSLAEAQRAASHQGSEKVTPTLFLHCPPVNEPLSTQEVTDTLQKVVSWVCSQ